MKTDLEKAGVNSREREIMVEYVNSRDRERMVEGVNSRERGREW